MLLLQSLIPAGPAATTALPCLLLGSAALQVTAPGSCQQKPRWCQNPGECWIARMSPLMGKQNNPKLAFDNCIASREKNITMHLAFIMLPRSQFMTDAVETPIYRSVLFLGKEGQCSSATLWSNNYNSMTNKMWKEKVFLQCYQGEFSA